MERLCGGGTGAVMVMGAATTAFAAYQKQATLNDSGIKISLDGKTVNPTDANGKTVEPFAIDGTTYLPIRTLANALDMDVEWDGANQTAKRTTEGAKAYTGTYEELGVEGTNLDICAWGDFYMVEIGMYRLWGGEGYGVMTDKCTSIKRFRRSANIRPPKR